MDSHQIRILAEIFASNARVLGMVAENEHRQSCGNSIAYGEEAFNAEAGILQQLARDPML